MKLKPFFIVKAVISFVDGLALMFIPTMYMSWIGVTIQYEGVIGAQFFGAMLIGIGLICWFSREGKKETVGGVLLSLFVADLIGFILSLRIQLAGQMNSLGWVVVAVWFILFLGLGYFRFFYKERKAKG